MNSFISISRSNVEKEKRVKKSRTQFIHCPCLLLTKKKQKKTCTITFIVYTFFF